ncbi:hypothetical protein CEE35_08515 [Candidatus Aerophobetes bacterium Ae_b3b]|nr:MAG: hypothetical protein CEE35_08515 [Candidatus Aerophobetes bacterium Ae_b3b]
MFDITILGKPIYLWMGILVFVFLLFTLFSGLNIPPGFRRRHKILALITIVLISVHLFFSLMAYFPILYK